MKRRLFNTVTALSLVLCLALMILWLWTLVGRSHLRLYAATSWHVWSIEFRRPDVQITLRRHLGIAMPEPGVVSSNDFGFRHGQVLRPITIDQQHGLVLDRVIRLPFWFGILLTGGLPFARGLLAARHRVRRNNTPSIPR